MEEIARKHWEIGGYGLRPDQMEKVKMTSHKLCTSVPTTLVKQEGKVRKQILDLIAQHTHLDVPIRTYINVALEELIVNALHHGHSWDLNKLVSVTLVISRVNSEIHLLLDVRDEDTTLFDPQTEIEEAQDPANLERPDGRGCLLIKHLAHFEMEVILCDGPPTGKIVRVTRWIPEIVPAAEAPTPSEAREAD